ncbi:MAG: hypothetical protein ACJZ12_02475 [Candidatus Neomarinimicrobiota bacterium]
MVISFYYQNFSIKKLMLVYVVLFSCSNFEEEEEGNPLLLSSFSYLQDVNKLYFSIDVESKYQGATLESVVVYWYGINTSQSPDIINLNDDGDEGDIIGGDNIFSRKISNANDSISNKLPDNVDSVFLDYYVTYGQDILIKKDTVLIGNIIPKIDSVYVETPITLPDTETIKLHLISVKAFDADGLETIKWVGFTSFHVEGDSLMNDGNRIYLYDDGSEVILYEPNFTSGDSIKGDGIFSFKIPVYGPGFSDPALQTKLGTFKWRFIAQDDANEYSNIVEQEVIIIE